MALAFLGFTACQPTKSISSANGSKPTSGGLNKESAVIWQQTAAEYTALCIQAYNQAKSSVDYYTKVSSGNELIIIMDLDETVLDNSPYNGYLIKNNKEYEKKTWGDWVNKASAKAVPGALDFIQYAESRGMTIFYVSNRSQEHLEPTMQNMEKLGIGTNPDHMLLKDLSSNKSDRRKYVGSLGDVVMYIGDNLADFEDQFEIEQGHLQRKEVVNNFQKMFGLRFIILPNTMYGGWEKALDFKDPLINEGAGIDKLEYLESFEIND